MEQDRELVARLLTGHKNAWQELVSRFQGLVYARVKRTLEQQGLQFDAADLEDVCAEVFASLLANDLSSLKSFQCRSRLSTWLSIIAHRICLRWLDRRNAARRQIGQTDRGLGEALCVESHESLQQMILQEDLEILTSRMRELRANDQKILKLFYMEELSYGEISKRMEISINSVGPKLGRAQRRLKDLMES